MRRAFTFVEFLVVLAIIGVLAAILFPVFGRTRCGDWRRSSCQANLKQIGLGVMIYAQDYDEKYPMAKTNLKTTWATSLQPYVKSWLIFDCPSAVPPPKQKVFLKPIIGWTTDYFYNRRLGSFNQTKLSSPKSTIMGGDGEDNAFLGSSISQLPVGWRADSDSPCHRHAYSRNFVEKLLNENLPRANYLFADGHVQSATSDQITLERPKKSAGFTFLTR